MKKNFFTKSISIMIILAFAAAGISMLFSANGKGTAVLNAIKYEKRAEEILADMTLEEKAGQMFMGCFYSYTPSPEQVDKYCLGGVLLFKPSFESTPKDRMTSKLTAIDEGCDIAPIVAVDEEGGDVIRVSASKYYRSKPFKSPRKLFAEGGIDAVIAETHEKNALLKEIGIDMNLAPVCDIAVKKSDYMYDRSLGQDAEITSQFAASSVETCIEDGIACSLKHFPGYGNAVDTHVRKAIDKRSLEQIMNNDILPFKAGIEAGAQTILVSHNTVTSIDKNLPASLSPAVNKLLREELGFEGIVITDDLVMGAVADYMSEGEIAVAAVKAGNDMLCSGDYDTQIKAVIKAVNSGEIDEERIDASVMRILKLKLELGILS